MSKDYKKHLHSFGEKQQAGPLRAIVFGSRPKQVKQMADQLIRKNIVCRSVADEKFLLPTLSEVDPELIFLEINGQTRTPIQEIVKAVFLWTNNYARKVNVALNSPSPRLWAMAQVILYKSDLEEAEINPTGDIIIDLDEVLLKCQDAGHVNYIGLYSSWSFYSKIEPLLTRQ